MYKSNLDPGEGNAKDGVRRTPSFFKFARHGRALMGASPEHAQIVGSV